PDDPRITYIKSIATPADIGRNPSTWKRLTSFVTGESGDREAFEKPIGIALDETGNLCLTDTGNNSIYFCDLAHKYWRRSQRVNKTPFSSPVAVARRNSTFYVADSEQGKVFAFEDNGRDALTLSAPLQRPVGLAIAGDALFVVDSQAHA